ncbi:MAG TPA: putative toxin-antitoxin system toxin component, PIN family [Burkholderiales bacterium]|nr:putative toxin-antitoxin system toxin component, PIN family [Burkholderiales bacterium]
MPLERIVVDTNALISRLLVPESLPGRAVRRAIDTAQLLVSEATLTELADVLSRPRFDAYVSIEDRQEFFRRLSRVVEVVPITYVVRACRDPNDDKFLELAVNGNADLIITGDDDLLVLHPFRGIPIMTPASFLER